MPTLGAVLLVGAFIVLLGLWAAWQPGRDHPDSPAQLRGIFRFVNLVGRTCAAVSRRPLFRLDPGKLEPDLLSIKRAEQELYGSLGSPSDLNGLRILFQSLEAPGSLLSTVGRILIMRELGGSLRHRQQVVAYVRSHPEVLRLSIHRPLIIAGLPRTGSTLLQRLLAVDPRSRAPQLWEMLTDPSPRPPTESEIANRCDPRIALVEEGMKRERVISPDFQDVRDRYHEVKAIHIEEEALLMRDCMWNNLNSAYGGEYESYIQWTLNDDEDKGDIYRYIKVWLQIQSSTYEPVSHWVLKTPSHSFFLPALEKEFPDANLVFIHRDPCVVVPSSCKLSLLHGAFRIDFRVYDPQAYGERVLYYLKTAGDLIIQHFKNSESEISRRALHIPYEDLVADPSGTVERIYSHFGYQMTDQFRANMSEYLARNRQHKHGKPDYSLKEFGLDEATVQKAFAEYIKTFRQPDAELSTVAQVPTDAMEA